MKVDITCPNCKNVYYVPEEYVGKRLKCAVCYLSFIANLATQENLVNDRSLSLAEDLEQIENIIAESQSKGRYIDTSDLDNLNDPKFDQFSEIHKKSQNESRMYFDNLGQVEHKWKEMKLNGYKQSDRDELWGLCLEGRRYFWNWALYESQLEENYQTPPNIPAYNRALMLLKYEKDYKTSIVLCKEILKFSHSDWYKDEITKLEKKQKLNE